MRCYRPNSVFIVSVLIATCVWLLPAIARAQSCYLVADQGGQSGGDDLLTLLDLNDFNPATNETNIGTGTDTHAIEAAALQPTTGALFAANGGQLGVIDLKTGVFAATLNPIGSGSGANGNTSFSDVDGLAFDATNGFLYGSVRKGGPDLLIRIDPVSGSHVNNAFGMGVDYVIIPNVAGNSDIDDLAIDPTSGVLYAIANNGGGGDRLITIDKSTGASTDVGPTGANDLEGLSIDANGQLWASRGSTSSVWEVNKNTGAASNPRPINNGSDYESVACMWLDSDSDGLSDPAENLIGSDPADPDTDNDGIKDGDEVGGDDKYDPNTDTNPVDADSDDDGISDGDELNGTGPLANYGPTDPLKADSDGDGLNDGLEVGLTSPVAPGNSDGNAIPFGGTDANAGAYAADKDPQTKTDPNDDDSDDDGLLDGSEDANKDGATSNTLGGTGESGQGETDPLLADTDGDGIQDGTELGLTAPEGQDTGGGFVPDSEPGTTTDPLDTDTDDGGVADGNEDLNFNGGIDAGEIDPNNPADDVGGSGGAGGASSSGTGGASSSGTGGSSSGSGGGSSGSSSGAGGSSSGNGGGGLGGNAATGSVFARGGCSCAFAGSPEGPASMAWLLALLAGLALAHRRR